MRRYYLFMLLLLLCGNGYAQRWTVEKARAWYDKQLWIVAADFVLSTAKTPLEMWKANTFDTALIRKELLLAAGAGLHCVRVVLDPELWQQDRQGFTERINTYLGIAHAYTLQTIFVLYDDAPTQRFSGEQATTLNTPTVERDAYVPGILRPFRKDRRILVWELATRQGSVDNSASLKAVFAAARSARPRQPLMVSLRDDSTAALNQVILDEADIIACHPEEVDSVQRVTGNRPVICLPDNCMQRTLAGLKAARTGVLLPATIFNQTRTTNKTDAMYFLKALTADQSEDFADVPAPVAFHDGPYVLDTAGGTLVRSIRNGHVEEERWAKGEPTVVPVVFADHPEWDFTVTIKRKMGNEPCLFPAPEKLFAISDIEGEFAGFRALLLAGGVIDEQYHWIYGKGHVVVCGDLFDRGLAVPETLWLLYKLEDEAKAHGGYVHTILGNHDIMNLSGDLRYVQPKYFVSADLMGVDYAALYSPETELGRWLRTKNTIEKIGEHLCVHGGVSPQVNESTLDITAINTRCRPYYDKVKVLHGVNDPLLDPFFTGSSSLFWYRGYFTRPWTSKTTVQATLQKFDVKRILVGHTIARGNIGYLYSGKVLALDVDQHKGDHQAALFENGSWYSVNDKGVRKRL